MLIVLQVLSCQTFQHIVDEALELFLSLNIIIAIAKKNVYVCSIIYNEYFSCGNAIKYFTLPIRMYKYWLNSIAWI